MSSSSKNWPVPSSFEEYLGQLNRRISGQERRQGPLLLSENLGPGLAARSKELRDWNDPEARFNGFFYSEPGASNTPDETKAWTGNVIARDNGSGMQQVWNTGNTEGTLYYIRTYTPISLADERVTFTDWKRFATESGLIDIEDLTPTVNFNIDTALAEAAEAFEFAVASNSTFRQDEEPVSDETYELREGDIWFDTNDENRAYVWSGSAWVDTRDLGIAAAEAAALQGQQDAADALAAAVAAQEDATDALASASTANTAAVTAANAAAAASFATENRVVNGSAENDLAGWTTESAGLSAVTEKARTGTKSFKTTGSGSIRQGPIPVTAGERWRYEWWYQTAATYVNGSAGGLRLQSSTDGVTFTDAASSSLTGNVTNWTYQKVEYTVPAGVTHIRARIAFAYSGGHAAWLDDVALTNITLTGNVIQSSDLPNRGIKFNDAALIGYDSTGTPTFSLTSATGALALAGPVVTGGSVTGSTVQTEVTAARGVKITSAGITGYDTGGTPKFVLSASTGQITSLDVTAGTITGALVQTTATAGRGVKLTSAGLFGYNGSGVETFSINAATGGVILTGSATIGGSIDSAIVTGGTLQTSSAGSTGVKINSTGIVGYGGGIAKFVLNASTGQITSLDVTAGTITGALIRTSTSSSRVEMTSSGIYAYNGGSQTFAITSAGGNGSFSGAVTGTTVTADTQLRAGSGTSYVNVDNIGGLSFVTNSTTRGTIQGFSIPHLSLSATTGNLQLSAAGGFDVRSLGDFTVTGGLTTTGAATVSGTLTCSRLEVGNGTRFNCITAGRATVTTNGSGTATINHGLGVTPISVQVMYEGANANYATLNSFNSTNFSYTMRNAAGDPILNASRTVNWVAFA